MNEADFSKVINEGKLRVFSMYICQVMFTAYGVFSVIYFFFTWIDLAAYSGMISLILGYRFYILAVYIGKMYAQDIHDILEENMPRKYRRKKNKK